MSITTAVDDFFLYFSERLVLNLLYSSVHLLTFTSRMGFSCISVILSTACKRQFFFFLLIFRRFYILYELFAMQMINMKCQALFSRKKFPWPHKFHGD